MYILRRGISVFVFFTCFLSVNIAIEQQDTVYALFIKFSDLYNSGDFIGAEKCMLKVLDPKSVLPVDYVMAAYNNLGLIKKSLGQYTVALDYYEKAENLILDEKENLKDLAFIYNNKSRIYTFQRSYPTAIEFLEKSIRIFHNLESQDKTILPSLSTAYLNLGIIYFELKDYNTAFKNFDKSLQLKLKNNLPETELTYLNLAKIYAQTGGTEKAEEYFTRCLNTIKIKFGENYFRMAEVYFGYGNFLYKSGRIPESLDAYRKALNICKNNYGEKHTLVALSYKYLGDYYLDQADYQMSLDYYQKSLIAIVPDFNNTDIYSNPEVDSSLFDIRLLDNLKSKAQALELLANEQSPDAKLNTITKSLETIELVLELIEKIRDNYLTEESRIYLAENEKETYLFAVHISGRLFALKGEDQLKSRIYGIAEKAKAAVLRE